MHSKVSLTILEIRRKGVRATQKFAFLWKKSRHFGGHLWDFSCKNKDFLLQVVGEIRFFAPSSTTLTKIASASLVEVRCWQEGVKFMHLLCRLVNLLTACRKSECIRKIFAEIWILGLCTHEYPKLKKNLLVLYFLVFKYCKCHEISKAFKNVPKRLKSLFFGQERPQINSAGPVWVTSVKSIASLRQGVSLTGG